MNLEGPGIFQAGPDLDRTDLKQFLQGHHLVSFKLQLMAVIFLNVYSILQLSDQLSLRDFDYAIVVLEHFLFVFSPSQIMRMLFLYSLSFCVFLFSAPVFLR